jgi:hypothetical protein
VDHRDHARSASALKRLQRACPAGRHDAPSENGEEKGREEVVAAYLWLAWWAALPIIAGAVIGIFSFRKLSEAAAPAAALFSLALAYVPLFGYLETLIAPLAGRRLARRADSRYAGLRVLAKD